MPNTDRDRLILGLIGRGDSTEMLDRKASGVLKYRDAGAVNARSLNLSNPRRSPMSERDSICASEEKPEEWRPVVGWEEFYDVSASGFVRSKHKTGRAVTGSLLRISLTMRGYCQVTLSAPPGALQCRSRTVRVHRLVLESFTGPCPAGHQCNHIDGDKKNNRIENLEWVTAIVNSQHAVKSGLRVYGRGESAAKVKLTESQVREIFARSATETPTTLSREFGVSLTTIKYIKKRKTWKHLWEGESG